MGKLRELESIFGHFSATLPLLGSKWRLKLFPVRIWTSYFNLSHPVSYWEVHFWSQDGASCEKNAPKVEPKPPTRDKNLDPQLPPRFGDIAGQSLNFDPHKLIILSNKSSPLTSCSWSRVVLICIDSVWQQTTSVDCSWAATTSRRQNTSVVAVVSAVD